MPIPLILIFAAGALAGATVGATVAVFWEEIKAWFIGAIEYVIDLIDTSIEVTSDAFCKLVKEGSKYYKEVEIISQNIFNNVTKRNYKREEIPNSKIPDEYKSELDRKKEILLQRYNTP